MMWPPVYTFVVSAQVTTLDTRKRFANRTTRRKHRFGKQSLRSKMSGQLSPKQMREAGL